MSLADGYNTWDRSRELADPVGNVFRGDVYFFRDRQIDIASSTTYYYGITTSPNLDTAVYIRALNAGEGPVTVTLHPAGAWTGQSSQTNPFNLRFGFPAAEMQISILATGVSGLVPSIEVDHAFASGNNVSVAGAIGLPTIFQPGESFILGINNQSTGVNPGIVLSLAFAELKIPSNF